MKPNGSKSVASRPKAGDWEMPDSVPDFVKIKRRKNEQFSAKIFGLSQSRVIRSLAANGYSFGTIRKILDGIKCDPVADSNIRNKIQQSADRDKDELDQEQIKTLLSFAGMQIDDRSEEQKRLDEAIANEPHPPQPRIDPDVRGKPLEHFLPKRPLAVVGIVENGVVRPLDPNVSLPERSRVIIVASDTLR